MAGGNSLPPIHIGYSYTIALSGLFELYTRGRHLNHEAKPSGLKRTSNVQSNKPR